MNFWDVGPEEVIKAVNEVLDREKTWISAYNLQPKVAKYLGLIEPSIIWLYNDAIRSLLNQGQIITKLEKGPDVLYYRKQ